MKADVPVNKTITSADQTMLHTSIYASMTPSSYTSCGEAISSKKPQTVTEICIHSLIPDADHFRLLYKGQESG